MSKQAPKFSRRHPRPQAAPAGADILPGSAAVSAPPAEDADEAFAATAAANRENLYDEVENAAWNGRLLEPFSAGRASLLARLVKADLPCADLDDLPLMDARLEALKTGLTDPEEIAAASSVTLGEVTGHFALYLPTAWKVLFLCSHRPEQFDHLRGSASAFLRAIESWAEQNVRPHQYQDACLLAQKLTSAHRSFVVIPRPRPGSDPLGE